MVEAGDCILVYFLTDEPLGKQFQKTRQQWPMHMTLVPWFRCNSIAVLNNSLEELAENVRPFDLTLGEVEQFHTGATVTVLADPAEEIKLHDALVDALAANGAEIINTDYVHAGRHRAHVTHHDGQPIPRMGETLHMGAFWLVRLLPNNICEVTSSFVLEGKL
jgi:hypothetical protein